MRFLLIIMVLALAGCGSDPEPQFTSEINFNIEGGFYESMKVVTWEGSTSVCSSLKIITPDYKTKWLPAARLNFLSDDGRYTATIMLAPHSSGDKELQLIYKLYDKESKDDSAITILKDHLKFGESVPVEVFFSGERGLGIRMENGGQIFNLPFDPTSFVVSGSSAKSQIKFTTDTCVASHKAHTASAKADSIKAK